MQLKLPILINRRIFVLPSCTTLKWVLMNQDYLGRKPMIMGEEISVKTFCFI
jgi:hypothetical protein